MDFSIRGVRDPRVEQIAADVAERMDKILTRLGFSADVRSHWMQQAGDSPLVQARALAEGFEEPPADLIGAALLVRPCVMTNDLDPQWVRTKYGSDIYERLMPLLSFFSVCEKAEDLPVRLKSGLADAKLLMMAHCLLVVRAGVKALKDDPAAPTDYGYDPAATEKLIEACRGANPVLEDRK